MTHADPPPPPACAGSYRFGRADLETLRQDQARALEDANYRSIFTHALEGIFQSTPDGRFIAVNPAMAEILGYDSPQELIEGITDIGSQLYVDPGRRDELGRRLRDQGSVADFVSQAYRKDGQVVWTRGNVRAVADASGEILFYEGTFADITGQKRLEEQLRQAQKLEALGRIAGGIAHDFNHLLAVILGYSDVLRARLEQDGESQELLAEIQRAANRASVLTRQLRAFSRKPTVKAAEVGLNQLVSRVEGLIRRVLGDRHTLHLRLDPGAGTVCVDAAQMEQALLNLAIHARDAMPQAGTLTLTTAAGKGPTELPVAAPASLGGCYAVLEVRDSGPGLDPELLAQIWEPFFATQAAERGVGLGLSMVFGFVRQCGGAIMAESVPGEGTTFRLYLPGGELSPREIPPVFHPEPEVYAGTALLVEDEEAVRGVVRALLVASGYQVLEAPGCHEAVSIYHTHPGRIDLVLTDLILPDGSGNALARELRRLRPEIPVLFMTGHSTQEVERLGVSWTAPELLHKPFPRQELVERIAQVLQGSREGASNSLATGPSSVPPPLA